VSCCVLRTSFRSPAGFASEPPRASLQSRRNASTASILQRIPSGIKTCSGRCLWDSVEGDHLGSPPAAKPGEAAGRLPAVVYGRGGDTGLRRRHDELGRQEQRPDPGAAAATDGNGAHATGKYRNLFVEAGHTPQDVELKIAKAYEQLFQGDKKTQRLCFPSGENENGPLVYIPDIQHTDVRSEGMSYGMMIAVQLPVRWDTARLPGARFRGVSRGRLARRDELVRGLVLVGQGPAPAGA
jgi:hypothetical protein